MLVRVVLVTIALTLATATATAADQAGRVTFGGLPVPGASVVARQGETMRGTATDEDGAFRLIDLAPGAWAIRVEMSGFEVVARDISIGEAANPAALIFELMLQPLDQIVASAPPPAPVAPTTARASTAGTRAAPAQTGGNGAFQRAPVTAAPASSAAAAPASPAAPAAAGELAADGLLVNGSVNNGAASPFAQLPAFGNSRRGGRSLFNGGMALLLNNSAFDSRPFSFGNGRAAKPSYSDVQINGSFAGPVKVPGLRNKANVFLGYQRTLNHTASTQSTIVPTLLERAGDFSQTLDPLGRRVSLVDPATSRPFAGNLIPASRISTQAAALLNYFPAANLDGGGRFNYQSTILAETHQDALQARFADALDTKNQLTGVFAYQRTTTDTSNVFNFTDATRVAGVDTTITWSHRFSPFAQSRLHYQFTRLATTVTPFFSGRINVSGDAGLVGNDQTPANWGPPALLFASGIANPATAQYAATTNTTHVWGGEQLWTRGRHNVTVGGDVRWQLWNISGQEDGRGTLSFTGAASGSDLADFLLGIPATSSISFGKPDKHFRSPGVDGYVMDDWRFSPSVTINAGVRWEYEAPITERFGRLANLDIAPGFAAALPVQATDPVGGVTNTGYPASLLRSDWSGLQPRIGIAWRPIAGSSLIVRGSYGIYRNTGVYEPIALLLAQQPPLSTTFSVENSAAHPITLADAFASPSQSVFAADPDLRIGYAQNWILQAQRDLPGSLAVTATYLGSRGSHLLQESLPNTYPAGATNPCATCPSGFVYLTSDGGSLRNAGQIQLRRRLRAGLSASTQYTLANATDNAGAFTGVNLRGSAIAQDWRDLDGEQGPSNLDQRHLLTAQVEYTTGAGSTAGLVGTKGKLLKNWTFTSQASVGTGLPLTPVYVTPVAGTGVTGTIRPDLTGASVRDAPSGAYLNPAAYTQPAPGEWGNAGRNSARGPNTFSLNGSIGRTFVLGDRLTLDWRIDATNLLNRVTYAAVNTIVGSPQFGLPTTANPMRKINSTMRLRF